MDNEKSSEIQKQVHVAFSLYGIIRGIQDRQGVFTIAEVVDGLVQEVGMSREAAMNHVERVAVKLSSLLHQDGARYRMIDPAPPTIAETIEGFKAMALATVKR